MSYNAQRFTTTKPVLPARFLINEHFENVAADEAEAFWWDEFYDLDSHQPRFVYDFDEQLYFERDDYRDFERTAYFYESSDRFDDYDDRMEDAYVDRYEYGY